MPDLREQLEQCFHGRVCLVGVGNVEREDDGVGMRLAEALAAQFEFRILLAGTSPERYLSELNSGGFDHVIFLDAVEFGDAPGSAVFLNAGEMAARFPQISTHKISLGMLAQWIEANGTTRAWLLGVQPASLKPKAQLTLKVQATLELLETLLGSLIVHPSRGGAGGQPAEAPTGRRHGARPAQSAIRNRQSAIP